jgi:hypothetical protein
MRRVTAVLGLAAVIVAACANPTPTPSKVPQPPSTPFVTPAPAADLVVTGAVREWCGSIGGCAYFITIDGPGGSWKGEFGTGGQDDELGVANGLPSRIPAGTYTLSLSSVMVSDLIANGVRQLGPADATCSAKLDVSGPERIHIRGLFDKGSCEVTVTS